MKRIATLFFLMVFFPSVLSAFEDIGVQTRENVSAADNLRMVLVPPESEGRDLDKGFLDWVENRITIALTEKKSNLSVLVRKDLELITDERNVQEGSFYDPKYRADFGNAAGVNAFGFFDLIDWGDRFVVYLDVISSSSGEIVSSARSVLRKTELPSRYMQLDNLQLEDLGSQDVLFSSINELVQHEGLRTLVDRRIAVARVQSEYVSEALQRAIVRDYHTALFRALPEGTRLLTRDFGRDLITAIREEMESTIDPDKIYELAPNFLGANVLVLLEVETDYVHKKIDLGVRYIDAEREMYLPGSARASTPLDSVYKRIYLRGNYLEIVSVPADVPVSIDGRSYGNTPAIAYGLEEGSHTVELEGVAPYARTRSVIEVRENEEGRKVRIPLRHPGMKVRVVDDDSGEPLGDYTVESPIPFSRNGGELVFSGLKTGAGAELSLRVEKEGYAAASAVFPLTPSMDPMSTEELRLVPQRKRRVTFLSTPEKALVFVDNSFAGRTPIEDYILDGTESEVDVRLQFPRWNTIKKTVSVSDIESEGVLSYSLSRDVLVRTIPPGAQIMVNGEPAGRSDREIELFAGPNTVEIQMGAFTRTLTFDPSENSDREIKITVTGTKKMIPVELVSNRMDVEVWVDDARAERKGGQVLLPEGYQRVRFALAGYAPEVKYLEAKRGASVHIHLLPVEQKALVEEVRNHIKNENMRKAEDGVGQLLEDIPDAPCTILTALEYYLTRMEMSSDKLLFKKSTINEYARHFDSLYSKSSLHAPEDLAFVTYLRARYADILSLVYEESVEWSLDAIADYEQYIDFYRGTDALLLSDGDAQDRFENAWYHRAELSYRQFEKFYRGTTLEEQQLRKTLDALYDYVRLPSSRKSADRMKVIRSYIAELQEK